MPELPAVLMQSPMALLVLDGDGTIEHLNLAATALGFETDRAFSAYLDQEVSLLGQGSDPADDSLPGPAIYRFSLPGRVKRCTIHAHHEGGRIYVWVHDLSEQLALADRLRHQSNPESRRLRQISNQVVTALGYAELLDVIIEDNEMLSPEKLAAVRQYQSEVSASMRRIHQVLTSDHEEVEEVAGTILVVDGHEDLSQLVAELLRAEGYKVVDFNDAGAALKYFSLNGDAVTKAVIDVELRDENKDSLISLLQAQAPALEIIALSNNAEQPGHTVTAAIQKPLDFHQLLQAIKG